MNGRACLTRPLAPSGFLNLSTPFEYPLRACRPCFMPDPLMGFVPSELSSCRVAVRRLRRRSPLDVGPSSKTTSPLPVLRPPKRPNHRTKVTPASQRTKLCSATRRSLTPPECPREAKSSSEAIRCRRGTAEAALRSRSFSETVRRYRGPSEPPFGTEVPPKRSAVAVTPPEPPFGTEAPPKRPAVAMASVGRPAKAVLSPSARQCRNLDELPSESRCSVGHPTQLLASFGRRRMQAPIDAVAKPWPLQTPSDASTHRRPPKPKPCRK
jgi:hypothetical protein